MKKFLILSVVSLLIIGCSNKNEDLELENKINKESNNHHLDEQISDKDEPISNIENENPKEEIVEKSPTENTSNKSNNLSNESKKTEVELEFKEEKNIKINNKEYELQGEYIVNKTKVNNEEITVYGMNPNIAPESVKANSIESITLEELLKTGEAEYVLEPAVNMYIISIIKDKLRSSLKGTQYSILIENEEYLFFENEFDKNYLTAIIINNDLNESKIKNVKIFIK